MTGKQSSFNEEVLQHSLRARGCFHVMQSTILRHANWCSELAQLLAPPHHHPLPVAGHVSGVTTYALILN